jgi:hypothetical protein
VYADASVMWLDFFTDKVNMCSIYLSCLYLHSWLMWLIALSLINKRTLPLFLSKLINHGLVSSRRFLVMTLPGRIWISIANLLVNLFIRNWIRGFKLSNEALSCTKWVENRCCQIEIYLHHWHHEVETRGSKYFICFFICHRLI